MQHHCGVKTFWLPFGLLKSVFFVTFDLREPTTLLSLEANM